QIPIRGPGGEGKPMYTVRITDEKAQENMAADKERSSPNAGTTHPRLHQSPCQRVQHNFPGSLNLSPFADPSGRRKSNASSTGVRSVDNLRGFLHRESTRGRRTPVRDLNPAPKAPKE
ncbi:hypothetical protein RUND412_009449, partial [Rhizina undulata]